MWKIVKSQKKLIINCANETIKPIVTLISEVGSEIIVAQEQKTYIAYVKCNTGFAYYKPIEYWSKDIVNAVYSYINQRELAEENK